MKKADRTMKGKLTKKNFSELDPVSLSFYTRSEIGNPSYFEGFGNIFVGDFVEKSKFLQDIKEKFLENKKSY